MPGFILQPPCHPCSGKMLCRRSHLRSAFSFAEVMFAVVILGVGFILLSAIFPVAAEQSRATNDEAVAARLADAAVKTIQYSTTNDDYPDTQGVMCPFSDTAGLWSKVSGNVINAADARYAWIPFYERTGTQGTVRISVLVVRRQLFDVYTPNDLSGDLQPRGISIVSITPQGDGTSIARIARDWLGMYQTVTDGSFLIMRSGDGDIAGRSFHVSQFSSADADSVSFTLVPGDGFAYDESCGSASAAVIGRDFADPANSAAGYAGPSQDIAVYTTIISPN